MAARSGLQDLLGEHFAAQETVGCSLEKASLELVPALFSSPLPFTPARHCRRRCWGHSPLLGSLSQATSGLSWVPGLGLAFRFPSPSGQFPLSDRFSPNPSPAASLKSHSFISRVSRFSHKYDLLLPQLRYRSFTSFPAHFFFSHPCFSEGTFWSGCSLYRLGIFILNCENSPFCGNAHPGHALNPSTIKPYNIPPSR